MNKEAVTIELLNKSYSIKCPSEAVSLLQKAAHFLEERMKQVRDNGGVLSFDRIAVIAALNLAYEFLLLESERVSQHQTLEQRLLALQEKIESVMVPSMELTD